MMRLVLLLALVAGQGLSLAGTADLSVVASAKVEAAPRQQPAPAPAPSTPSQEQPAKPPSAQENYSYNPEGRRDPFISLLVRGREASAAPTRIVGLGGLTIGDVALRGIVRSRGSFIAILQSPENKSYIVKVGDRLADGFVKAISADAVVFAQEVKDPLSLVKQRDIRKPLRTIEEGA
jgi:Tfp pilus assembly protein PilP